LSNHKPYLREVNLVVNTNNKTADYYCTVTRQLHCLYLCATKHKNTDKQQLDQVVIVHDKPLFHYGWQHDPRMMADCYILGH